MKEWNAQKRKECKRKCKAHVAAHLGFCIGANVLYSLPIILLMLIVYLTMFGSSFALLVAGADESAVAQAMLRGTGSGLFTAVLLLLVVSGPLTFGLMRFYTDLTRGGRPGAGAVLQPITSGASLWTGIRMSFCLFLRSLMWTVPPTVLLTIGAVAVSAISIFDIKFICTDSNFFIRTKAYTNLTMFDFRMSLQISQGCHNLSNT